jgi:large subunit ribosomal protein L15
MVRLNQLPKSKMKRKKRVGRGYGSGKGGHTAGRGAKGFKARGKVPLAFSGTKMKKSFLKRLPLQRGKGKFKTLRPQPVIVNLKYLNLLPEGSEVDLELLIKHGLVDEKEAKKGGVKILGEGKIEKSLKVKIPCSTSAGRKIKKAGGEVVSTKRSKKG